MSEIDAVLEAHLETGVTTLCHCWSLKRRDGMVLGFTDHDQEIIFDDITFRPDTGLSALALQQTTGLSVDNTGAIGAISDISLREDEIEAGRYDGAEVRAWLANWQDVQARQLLFRGTIGEIKRAGGAFEAEIRGLTDALNVPLGRVYQKSCSAVLGDRECGFDLNRLGYFAEGVVEEVEENRVFRFEGMNGFDDGWFRHGVLRMVSGPANGLSGLIKRDRIENGIRIIELWQPIRLAVMVGDAIRLEAGCDKRMPTCQLKFENLLNFQGFPDIPGDDWTITDPTKTPRLDGGSRRR